MTYEYIYIYSFPFSPNQATDPLQFQLKFQKGFTHCWQADFKIYGRVKAVVKTILKNKIMGKLFLLDITIQS